MKTLSVILTVVAASDPTDGIDHARPNIFSTIRFEGLAELEEAAALTAIWAEMGRATMPTSRC